MEKQKLVDLYRSEKDKGNPAKRVIIDLLRKSGMKDMESALYACEIELCYTPKKKRKSKKR